MGFDPRSRSGQGGRAFRHILGEEKRGGESPCYGVVTTRKKRTQPPTRCYASRRTMGGKEESVLACSRTSFCKNRAGKRERSYRRRTPARSATFRLEMRKRKARSIGKTGRRIGPPDQISEEKKKRKRDRGGMVETPDRKKKRLRSPRGEKRRGESKPGSSQKGTFRDAFRRVCHGRLLRRREKEKKRVRENNRRRAS